MLRDTLYAKYIREREGLEILEDEVGFVTYKIVGQECFIGDMCIEPEKREKGEARRFIGKLARLAQDAGCTFISANIDLKDSRATNTLLAALHIGFFVAKAEYGILSIIKKLGA